MKILNYGSLNIDHVFRVDHIVTPGETIDSDSFQIFPGGKGLNQSLAAARAGAPVWHAGFVGDDGEFLLDLLRESGADCSLIRRVPGSTGSTFIQVDASGQNSIVLFGGTNRANTAERVAEVVGSFAPGDILLLQNEINQIDVILQAAYERGLTVVLNPSPMNSAVTDADISGVSLFIMNETEGEQITGKSDPSAILDAMRDRFPQAGVVLTLGKKGAWYQKDLIRVSRAIYPMPVVDSTAAGDTFTGYYLAAMIEGQAPEDCLAFATKASAIAVSRPGAAGSIPWRHEVEALPD